MNFKNMREYTHEEFVNLVSSLNEEELLELSAKYGGYPVLFRMALDERINHIPSIQTGAAIIIRNKKGQILLQERTDRDEWGLPGGCQNLGEDLKTTVISESRKNIYPNGDIVYNNTSLYLGDTLMQSIPDLAGDSETKGLKFFSINELPKNLMDKDLINAYINYINEN